MRALIYNLVDSSDDSVIYVGYTTQTLEKRMSIHSHHFDVEVHEQKMGSIIIENNKI